MQNRKLYIIKIGGNVLNNEKLLSVFLDDFAGIEGTKILVHGGGRLLEELASRLGIEQHMVQGRRITDTDTLELAVMVYAGLINKKLVCGLQARVCNAAGVCGADANLIQARLRPVKEIDFGLVGDVTAASVNVPALKQILDMGQVPVFSSVTHDGKGQLLNTNADGLAAALASAMASEYQVELHYCFEKSGVLRDQTDDNSVIPQITREAWPELVTSRTVNAGMIPKLETAFKAINSGTEKVVIGHASDITHNIFEHSKRGTSITA